MEERGHILNILKNTQKALKKQDVVEIKNLSNRITNQSSAEQDPDIISLAVIIYALSKLIEREEYKKYKNWDTFYNNYKQGINNLLDSLEKNDIGRFRKEIELIRNSISKLSGKLKIYISEVFRNAQINKASKIYEHGISMEKTAKILGITVWELAEYAGKSKTMEVNMTMTLPIKNRIKIAEDLFNQ